MKKKINKKHIIGAVIAAVVIGVSLTFVNYTVKKECDTRDLEIAINEVEEGIVLKEEKINGYAFGMGELEKQRDRVEFEIELDPDNDFLVKNKETLDGHIEEYVEDIKEMDSDISVWEIKVDEMKSDVSDINKKTYCK